VLAATLAAVLLAAPPPVMAAWLRPVPGEVVRPFDYATARPFLPHAHRGVDLAAEPGAAVRAACGGRVLHAGEVADLGRVVTVLCGTRRVTYLPLATLTVRAGDPVHRGARIGTVAAGHGGLHVGMRRAGSRWAYEDPLARMGDDAPASPVAVRPAGPVRRPSAPRIARPVRSPRTPPSPSGNRERPATPALERPGFDASPREASPTLGRAPGPVLARPAHAPSEHPGTAPLLVWLGAALVLAGCVGSFSVAGRRRRTVAARTARPVQAPP
jgi:hypothetical protein